MLLGMILISLIYMQPVTTQKTLLISPDTVRYHASFIDSSVTINDLTIHFGTGHTGEELLRVPIAAPGELKPHSLIRITVGLNPPSSDNDPKVGISDGSYRNQFFLVEYAASHYSTVNPCRVYNGAQNGRSGPAGNPIAGEYSLLFDPEHRFGSCTTNNGFNTDGKFIQQIDTSKELNLVVHRDSGTQQYTFHYFLVEII